MVCYVNATVGTWKYSVSVLHGMLHLIVQEFFSSIEDVLPRTDVLYMTRIQRERFPSQESYDKVCSSVKFL